MIQVSGKFADFKMIFPFTDIVLICSKGVIALVLLAVLQKSCSQNFAKFPGQFL